MILDFINKLFNLSLAAIFNVFEIGNIIFKTTDLSSLFFIALGLLLYGVFIGETHLILIILSIYLSYTIISFLPINNPIFNFYSLNFYFRLSIFIAFIIIIYLLLANFYHPTFKKRINNSLIRIFILSILGALLFGVLASGFITSDIEYYISNISKTYLLDTNWKFILVILPLLIIGLKRKKFRSRQDESGKYNED